MNPQIQLMLQQAIQAFQGQNFDRADSILSKVVKLAPQNLAALHILGLIKASQEKFKEAADLLSKAARINPNDPSIQYNLAKALSDSGLNEESIVHHKKAVDLAPNNLDAWMNYGRALSKLAQHEDSLMCFDRVIAVNPNYSEAFLNKGIAHKALKHYPDAMASFDKAINLSPDLYGACIHKGSILYQFRYLEEALNSFDRAISLKPDSFEAYVSRSSILHALKHFDEALLACGKAISLQPDNALAYFNNGVMLRELGRLEEAKISFAKALEINPDYVNARWEIPFLTIPNIFPKEENLHALRESFASELEGLDKWLTIEKLNEAYEAVGATQPFYLAYQELNNKELLSKYGNICNRVMAHWQNLNKLKISEKKESGKIKVGIVSDHIRNHSVWNAIIKGWVLNLDADKIEVHIFHLGNIVDEETHLAESIATSFTSMPDTLLVWGSIIIEKNIEYIPGLFKLFDEGIVNCRDHVVRMLQAISAGQQNCIPVSNIEITISEDGTITMLNDGNGIDVAEHPEHKTWIPQMIFGELRTSTNYDKEEKKIVGGKNGFGFKLVLIWSTYGSVETVDHFRGLKYVQEFKDNLSEICKPSITKCK
ncbi:MAG: tetratricopeptide repeat protein, partial [Actinomycetes bacterium]